MAEIEDYTGHSISAGDEDTWSALFNIGCGDNEPFMVGGDTEDKMSGAWDISSNFMSQAEARILEYIPPFETLAYGTDFSLFRRMWHEL